MSSKAQGKNKNTNYVTKGGARCIALRSFGTKETALPVVGRALLLFGW